MAIKTETGCTGRTFGKQIFFFCPKILTFPKCLKRRETDAVSVMLSSVLPSKAKLCLFSMLFLLGSIHVNYVVHSQNPEKLSCLFHPFADLPTFSGAPQAQSTTKELLGLGICLPRCCCQHLRWGLEDWGVREHFLHLGILTLVSYRLCVSLSVYLLVTCVTWALGKMRGTERRKQKPALAFSLPESPMPTRLFQRLVMLYVYFDILCMQTYLPLGLGVYVCDCLWPWCSEQTIFAFEMQ